MLHPSKKKARRRSYKLIFNIPLVSQLGYVPGAYIKPVGIQEEQLPQTMMNLNINQFHSMLGHPGDEYVQATAKALNINLTGKLGKCLACLTAKT